jgi:4-hydroxy-tetrahydrodipicolinate synthase
MGSFYKGIERLSKSGDVSILRKIEGTYCVMVTPFGDDENVEPERFKSNIDYYIENAVHGLVVGGSTGEFHTLNPEEHKQIIKIAVDQVNGRVPLIAGTAHCSTRYTIEMSKYAEDVGVDGLMIVPPFYSLPKENEIYEHYSAISNAVNIPIMLYNNPFTSKVDMKPELVEKLSKLQNITHIKESSGDVTRIWKIRRLTKDKLTVFCGTDNLAFESFMMGAKGWICVAANILPKECADLYNLTVIQKDLEKAKDLYNKLLPLCSLLEDTGMFAGLSKAGLDLLGKSGGKPRKPMMPPEQSKIEQLKSILKTFGKL